MKPTILAQGSLLALIAGCGTTKPAIPEPAPAAKLIVSSTSFPSGGAIPDKFSKYNENVSPALSWTEGPPGTAAYALIVEDPDAPRPSPFVHWILFNLPSSARALEEGSVPKGVLHGKNDADTTDYYGPKPPSGTHRYMFKVYALDKALELQEGANKDELVKAMTGHTLAIGEVTGTFSHGS